MANIAKRRAEDVKIIDKLETQGYAVRIPAPYQYRIEGTLDVFVTTRRWHDLKTGKRGAYGELDLFIPEWFDPKAKAARRHNAFLAIRRKRMQKRPMERATNYLAWAVLLAFLFLFALPILNFVQDVVYNAQLSEIQEECAPYDDFRLCPLLK